MTPVEPQTETHIVPSGTEAVVYAKDQPEYIPLPALRTPDGRVLSQWKPDGSELELLKRGVPVTIVLWTFGAPLPAIQIGVGGIDIR